LCVDHYTIDADSSGWSVGLLSLGEFRRACRLVAFDAGHMVWTTDRAWETTGRPRPPRLPLTEVLRLSDSIGVAQVAAARGSVPDSILDLQRVRYVWIYPHQDPGTRVTEEQLADTMRVIIEKLSHSRAYPASH
jgi:hypothetical protein